MDDKLAYGIIGVLLIAMGGGAYVLLTPEQLDAAYTCTTSNVTGIFERFSSTYKTAYWTQDGMEKQSTCRNGVWIPTKQWLKNNGLSEKDVVVSQDIPIDEPGVISEEEAKIDSPIISENAVSIDQVSVKQPEMVIYEGNTYKKVKRDTTKERVICDNSEGCDISWCYPIV